MQPEARGIAIAWIIAVLLAAGAGLHDAHSQPDQAALDANGNASTKSPSR